MTAPQAPAAEAVTPPEGERTRTSRLRRSAAAAPAVVARERAFVVVLAAGALLRVITILGYRPVLWFNDAFEYLGVALRFQAYPVRPIGYSVFLRLLLPFHSFELVVVVQHLMGLGVAVLMYALMRHWQVGRLAATLASVPQLLDAHQIELEHLMLSDTVFAFLVTLAITLLAWRARPSPVLAGLAALLIAAATLTRTIGLPLLIACAVYLLLRRVHWRSLTAYLVVALAPLIAFATWFHSQNGNYALNNADGVFLYSRVMSFAECSKIHPPADLAILCSPLPPDKRPPSSNFIWHASPLDNVDHVPDPQPAAARFTKQRDALALKFAEQAIIHQPLAYLRVGTRDFVRTFGWDRTNFPNPPVVAAYTFSLHPPMQPSRRVYIAGGTAGQDVQSYEHGKATTRVVEPFARIMIAYQRGGFLPGTLLIPIILAGAYGLISRRFGRPRDDRRMIVLLLWGGGMLMLVVPNFTAQFDYRYVMPSVPFLCAAAAVTATMLRGNLSRGGGAAPTAAGTPDSRDRTEPVVDEPSGPGPTAD
ncbi:MAG: hypothetical protein QOE97_3269 [Pseudonocardiales bacterium]|jgi:hypothetical protein|nr:hypothetical protein [Pseudonocardiales bacterium]